MKARVSLRAAAAAAISVIVISLPALAHGPAYTFTFLGTLPGAPDSASSAISESGDVAGVSGGHAFLYHKGRLVDLGTLGGSVSFANALNDSHQVVGGSSLPGDLALHAFLFRGGRMLDLGSLGGDFSIASGISQSGDLIVGQSATSSGLIHAFQFHRGRMHDLGTLGGGFSAANAVNDSGQVVGVSSLAGNLTRHAFLSSGSHLTDIDPGIQGGLFSVASAVNQNGRIVVFEFNDQGAPVPFVYHRGAFTRINLPSGDAYAIPFSINDSGTVVGISGDVNGPLRVFLSHGSMTLDLNTVLPDLCFLCQVGINDNGQIAGTVGDPSLGPGEAVILTPVGGGGSQNAAVAGPSSARSTSHVTWEKALKLAGSK